jgi:type 1 glutamine amidotransferase
MGAITNQQLRPVLNAVQSGVGIAGCHGGMCDAFRDATDWHFMTGGQWVAHPGNNGTRYRVNVGPVRSAITEGVGDFDVVSEQYYMHVDPAVKALATTRFPVDEVVREGPRVLQLDRPHPRGGGGRAAPDVIAAGFSMGGWGAVIED